MDAWTWFLKLFLEGFLEWGQRDNASIISDRDKGLVPAAREVMPSHIPHYFRAWHLEQNLKQFGKAATAFFWHLVKCCCETKWVALVGAASQPVRSGFPEGNTSAYDWRGGGLAGRGGMNAPGRRARAHKGIGVPSGIPDEGDGVGVGFGIGRGGMVEALLHLDVVAEGEAVALQGRVLAGEVEECPLGAIVESRGVADQNLLGLVMEEGECRSVGPPGSRGVSVKDGPALEVEGGESRLVGLLEGRGVPEQDGPALEMEGGESRWVGLLEGRGVPEGVSEQDGPALEVEGGDSRLLGFLEGKGVLELDGPALEEEGGESRLVGLLEGKGVPEQDGPTLEVEGGESRWVGLLEGRGVPEQDGLALEVEGGESHWVGLLEGRGVPEEVGPALEVEAGESHLVGLLEGRGVPEQDGPALGVDLIVDGRLLRMVQERAAEQAPASGQQGGTGMEELCSQLQLPWALVDELLHRPLTRD
ncbi:unnamed protein product [Closterium sp. NIES-65]|nr:unnamed protein product [Closterium sp. NIES-65]CAI6012780.1 unnamed protein product [Closterium sp. NIES-65]